MQIISLISWFIITFPIVTVNRRQIIVKASKEEDKAQAKKTGKTGTQGKIPKSLGSFGNSQKDLKRPKGTHHNNYVKLNSQDFQVRD